MENYTRPMRIFVFILVLVLSMGIIAGAYTLAHTRSRQDDAPIALNCSSIDNLQTDKDQIYFYVDDVLYCYSEAGSLVWQHTLGPDANYRVYDEGIAAWLGNQLFLIARTGSILYSGTLATPISSCAMCADYAAVETVVNGQNVLKVIEHNGSVIDTLDVSSLTLLDYGFFSSKNMMWVMTLNTDGTVPLTQVDTHLPARLQTGSIPDSRQVVYQVVIDNNDLMLIGTNNMTRYTYAGRKQNGSDKLIYGWYYMDSHVSGQQQAYIFVPAREIKDSLTIKNMRVITASKDYNVHFQLPCMTIHAGAQAAYAISNQYVFKNVYGNSGTLAYPLPLHVDQVVSITDSGTAVVVSDQRVYLIKLP